MIQREVSSKLHTLHPAVYWIILLKAIFYVKCLKRVFSFANERDESNRCWKGLNKNNCPFEPYQLGKTKYCTGKDLFHWSRGISRSFVKTANFILFLINKEDFYGTNSSQSLPIFIQYSLALHTRSVAYFISSLSLWEKLNYSSSIFSKLGLVESSL